jgi:hypothetical protein
MLKCVFVQALLLYREGNFTKVHINHLVEWLTTHYEILSDNYTGKVHNVSLSCDRLILKFLPKLVSVYD